MICQTFPVNNSIQLGLINFYLASSIQGIDQYQDKHKVSRGRIPMSERNRYVRM
jgi:hypothetical protein